MSARKGVRHRWFLPPSEPLIFLFYLVHQQTGLAKLILPSVEETSPWKAGWRTSVDQVIARLHDDSIFFDNFAGHKVMKKFACVQSARYMGQVLFEDKSAGIMQMKHRAAIVSPKLDRKARFRYLDMTTNRGMFARCTDVLGFRPTGLCDQLANRTVAQVAEEYCDAMSVEECAK